MGRVTVTQPYRPLWLRSYTGGLDRGWHWAVVLESDHWPCPSPQPASPDSGDGHGHHALVRIPGYSYSRGRGAERGYQPVEYRIIRKASAFRRDAKITVAIGRRLRDEDRRTAQRLMETMDAQVTEVQS